MWQTALWKTHLKKWLLCTSHMYLIEHSRLILQHLLLTEATDGRLIPNTETSFSIEQYLGKTDICVGSSINKDGKDRTNTVLGRKNFGRHCRYVPSGGESQQQNTLFIRLFGGFYLSNSCVLTTWGQCETYALKVILEGSRFVSRISQDGKIHSQECHPT